MSDILNRRHPSPRPKPKPRPKPSKIRQFMVEGLTKAGTIRLQIYTMIEGIIGRDITKTEHAQLKAVLQDFKNTIAPAINTPQIEHKYVCTECGGIKRGRGQRWNHNMKKIIPPKSKEQLMSHSHNHCKHKLRHCVECDVVSCKRCGKFWVREDKGGGDSKGLPNKPKIMHEFEFVFPFPMSNMIHLDPISESMNKMFGNRHNPPKP